MLLNANLCVPLPEAAAAAVAAAVAAARNHETNRHQQDSQHHQIVGLDPAAAGASKGRPFVQFQDPLQQPISQGMFDDEMLTMPTQINTMDETTSIWSDNSPPLSLDAFDIPETMWCAFDLDFSKPVFPS